MRRVIMVVIFLAVAAAAGVVVAVSAPETPKLEKGIYLFMGSGCMKVENSGAISLFIAPAPYYGDDYEVKAEHKDKRLILHARIIEKKFSGPDNHRLEKLSHEWKPVLELLPSKKTPGDWDLVVQHHSIYDFYFPLPANLEKKPITSCLHKIDDERAVEFIKYRRNKDNLSQDRARVSSMAKTIVDAHPDDPFARMFLMDALILQNFVVSNPDTAALARELARWKPVMEGIGALAYMARQAESSLAALKYSKDKGTQEHNGYYFVNCFYFETMGLEEHIQYLPKVWHCQEYAQQFFLFSRNAFNKVPTQIQSKVAIIAADFFMLQGRREEALQTVASLYRMGQLMNQGGQLIDRLVGIAIRNMAAKGLETYAMNCLETPEDCLSIRKYLDELSLSERDTSQTDLFWLEPAGPFPDMIGQANRTEFTTRHKIADSRFRVLNLATAAREYLVREKQFPTTRKELESILPKGIPEDPFSSDSLKFRSDPTTFTCYSMGPDKADNGGFIEYDPTNGSLSGGDISIKVPRNRAYPFPRDGARASTREELLRQFPNGLPPDPFADTRGKPLGVTNTTPVCIYSLGPDRNEHEEKRAQQEGREYYPEVLYDPTNGATSRGDLTFMVRQ